MKHYSSPEGACPFYRWEEERRIQCEGILDGTVMGTFFQRQMDVVEHRRRYCYDVNGWEGCSMARAILERTGE